MTEPNNEDIREQVGRLQSQQAVDPTANVLEHVAAAVRRLDDLARQQADYIRREMDLRAQHQKELASAEKERLDAIRAIDAQSINLASSAVTQVQAAMDSKINQLSERAQQQLATTATLLQDRIGAVERQQYVNAGAKSQVVESRQQNQWGVTLAGTVLGLGIAAAGIAVALSQ